MKDFKLDYVLGRKDNYRRLKRQLKTLKWYDFKKRREVKTMMSIAITTDYQETMAELGIKGNDMIMDCKN